MFTERILPALALSVGTNAYEDMEALMVFGDMCKALGSQPPVDLKPSWAACEREAEEWHRRETVIWDDENVIEKVVGFMGSVQEHYSDQFDAAVRSGAYNRITGHIASRMQREANIARNFTEFDYDGLANVHWGLERLLDNVRFLLDEPATEEKHLGPLEDAAEWLTRDKETTEANLPVEEDDGGYHRESDAGDDDVGVEDLMKDL